MGKRKKEKLIRNVLRQRLEMLGKTQSWLSQETGISLHHINALINCRWNPQLSSAMKIAKALVAKIDDLWFY